MNFLGDLGECGFSNGPCYGIAVTLELRKLKVDEYIEVENGKIGFISTKDTLAPIIFKLDKKAKIKWALKLETDSCSGIPLREMSGMRLSYSNNLQGIAFFNDTYSEPGKIYLNDEYDFEYLCLSSL